MFKIAVVPTGEKTAEGKDIFKAAPTETDIKRAVSEKRVQTFRSGKKVSDTQRVQLPTGEFVTIASAKALSKAGSATFIQAQQKQAEIDRLTQEAVKQAGFDIEKITRRQDSQREKVAKLIIAESNARGTKAEDIFRQRRIEEQEKLGKLERGAAVLVRFTTAAGMGVIQAQVFPKKVIEEEEARPKGSLELFSEEAQKQLGLTETTQGLLQISTEEGRKVVVERGRVRADIPVSAEFRTGFEKFVGTGDFPSDFEKALRVGGVFTFGGRVVTGKQLLGEPKKAAEFLETKISPITTRIFRTEVLEQEQKRIRKEINKLEGLTDRGSIIQRRLLKGELANISVEIRFRKQFGEQPVESALLFGGGALVTKGVTIVGIAGKPLFKIGVGTLGALFVGGTALESRLALEEGGIEAAAGVVGERFAEAIAFIAGGTFAARFGVKPKKVKVLKAKELRTVFTETLETKGTSAKNLQRLGLRTEVKTRVTRFRRGIQTRIIKTPKDPAKLAKLLEDPRIRFEFRIIEGAARQVLVREILPTIVRPKIRPEAFELRVDGKLGLRLKDVTISTDLFDVRVGEVKGIVDVKDLSRIIDPTLFKRISIKGLPKDVTVLQRDFISAVDKPLFDFRAELLGKGLITGKVQKVTKVADIFGIDLFPPQVVTDFTTIGRLGFKPILAVSPIFEPSPRILFPTFLFDFDREVREPKVKRKFFFDTDIDRDFKQGLVTLQQQISKTRQKQKPLLEQLTEQQQRLFQIQKPILDVPQVQKQLPVLGLVQIQEQKPILDIRTDLRTDLIVDIVEKPEPPREPPKFGIPRRKKPKEIIKGRFEGYNAFVKGRKGKQLKVNLRRTMTKKSALSASARVVDTSLSASGSIKKAISKNPPIDTKDNYFQNNRSKFRTFMKRKGKRIPLKNRFIELRKHRLDTKQEVNKIQAARRIKQVRKRLIKFEIFEEPKKKKRRRRQTVGFF